MEVTVSRIRVLDFLNMRESVKVNIRSGVRVWLGRNVRQSARVCIQIGSQYRRKIVAMEVLGSQIGGHTQWGIRETEKKRSQIGSLPQRGIGDISG